MFGYFFASRFGKSQRNRKPRSARRRPGFESLETRTLLAAGVLVSPVKGLHTSEDGGFATVSARLAAAPTADVTISLASDNTAEGVVSKSQLVFTAQNWNIVQQFHVTGQPDGVRDGNKIYHVITGNSVSTDRNYNGLNVPDVTLTNLDSRKLVAGFTVSKTSGLTTTEAGGAASLTVKLTYRPTADVTIPVASDTPTEGIPDKSLLTFTTDNWSQPQTVTVTGQPDGVLDGNKTYHVNLGPAASADPLYSALPAPRVTLTNRDSRVVADIVVSPTKGLLTTELGGQTSFAVKLTYRPTANVTVPVASDDASEGTPDVRSLTFTPDNWDIAQSVTVAGQAGNAKDGNKTYHVKLGAATSDDRLYNGRHKDVTLTNLAAIVVAPTSITTTEDGGSASYTLVLIARPTANVTIPVVSSNASAGTPNVDHVTFTPDNWNQPQHVVVTGHDSGNHTGSTLYTIVNGPAASDDPRFNHLLDQDVSAINQPGVGRFDGSYSGTMNGSILVPDPEQGTVNPVPVNATLACDISNGIVTASIGDPEGAGDDWTGTGTIDASGYFHFVVTNGSRAEAEFFGTLAGDAPTINGSGTWTLFDSDNSASGSGPWNIHLNR